MTAKKAELTSCYTRYSPKEYASYLLDALNYDVPFGTMKAMKPYSDALVSDRGVRMTFAGSSYGFDSAALLHNVTRADLIKRWTDDETVFEKFPPHNSDNDVTMIDIEPEPLRFATDVRLCDRSFVANLARPYAPELERHLNDATDMLVASGVTSYIGLDGLERLLQAGFADGRVKFLCFSALRYLDSEAFVNACHRHGLIVRKIRDDLKQRDYASEEEQRSVLAALDRKGIRTQADERDMLFEVYIAFAPETTGRNGESSSASAATLLIVDGDNRLVGCTETEGGRREVIPSLPHPWHLALSDRQFNDPAVRETLKSSEIEKEIGPTDFITVIKGLGNGETGDWRDLFNGS